MSEQFTAHFDPQAWVRDYAISVDPQGEQTWDATAGLASMPRDYREQIVAQIDRDGQAVDNDDWLKGDPDAPEWVREWSGPFTITIQRNEEDT